MKIISVSITKKSMFLLTLFFFLFNVLQAQKQELLKLSIGDTLPDIKVVNVYNYPTSSIQMSDLKGKLVILDFWATWCGSCINAFPKMEELQKKFSDKIQILLVNAESTKDDERKVDTLFKRKKDLTGYYTSLPYILKEKQLSLFFPYRYVPHYVWIGKGGVVLAITASREVTEKNIQKVLKSKKSNEFSLHMKEDVFDFDYTKPLFVNGNGGNDDAFLYRSIMSGYKEGLGRKSGSSEIDSNRIRFFSINTPILSLIKSGFKKEMDLPRSRILFEGQKANALKSLSGNDYTNLLCYELIIPSSSKKVIAQYIKEDIERFLQLTVKRRKMDSKCLILTLSKPSKDHEVLKGDMHIQLDTKYLRKYIQNAPVCSIAYYLSPFLDIPIVDETNSSQKVSIYFDNLYNKSAIVKSLEKAGFKISEGRRELEFAIITDYGGNNN